jgi:hypothetical protein
VNHKLVFERMTSCKFVYLPADSQESSAAQRATARHRQPSTMWRSELVSISPPRASFAVKKEFQEEQLTQKKKITFLFSSIYRSFKNRFAVQQHVVRGFQTTAQLKEVVKVPPFADSVSEGDVK